MLPPALLENASSYPLEAVPSNPTFPAINAGKVPLFHVYICMISTTSNPKTDTSFHTKHEVVFLVFSLCTVMALEADLKTMQGNNEWQDCDDTAETLSLCDLPLNSFASDSDDFSKEEQSPSLDHDLFEFISEDFTASSYNDPKETIIFCGKLISYQGAKVADDEARDREFRSIPGYSRKGEPYSPKKLRKSTDKHDNQISILAAPIKSRWYLLTFGVGKFPMEMKPKMAQSRRNPSKKSQKKRVKSLWDLLICSRFGLCEPIS